MGSRKTIRGEAEVEGQGQGQAELAEEAAVMTDWMGRVNPQWRTRTILACMVGVVWELETNPSYGTVLPASSQWLVRSGH